MYGENATFSGLGALRRVSEMVREWKKIKVKSKNMEKESSMAVLLLLALSIILLKNGKNKCLKNRDCFLRMGYDKESYPILVKLSVHQQKNLKNVKHLDF